MAIRGAARLLEKKPVRRCLFGAPDHERVRVDLDRALAEMDKATKAELKSKWGYDVDVEYPEAKDSEYVPSFYRKVYRTKTKKVMDTDSLETVDMSPAQDFTAPASSASTTTTNASSNTESQNRRTIVTGVRRLDFKENCIHSAVHSSTSSPRVRTPRVSVLHQSKMSDHYQTRKRRHLDVSTTSRGKSPRL